MARVRVVRNGERRSVRGSGVRSAPRGTRVRTEGWARQRLVGYAWPRAGRRA
jgi:hypothetical protein